MAGWRLFHRGNSKPTLTISGLRTAEELRRVIERERDLADRFDGCFSLLIFQSRDNSTRIATLTQLAEVLRSRVRTSDEVGWLDQQHTQIGVVMHRTPGDEAWKIGDGVLAAFPSDIPPPSCSVRYYPSDASLGNDLPEAARGADPAKAVGPMEVLFVKGMPAWKRGLDILASSIALLLLSPLFLVIATVIKLTSRGPVFFSQPRRGWGGKRFVIHKFRSMSTDAEEKHHWLMTFNEQDGPAFKMKFDPRVTTVGRFLRKTSLDELPQLWTVLRGDMTLVGPRPLVCPEADACSVWQRRRLDVTPGITCIWQIKGSRDNFDDWMRLDLRYIRSRTFWGDIKLLLETIPVVFVGRRAGF
jgi:lipopolysaccharide/colanic/teichoic acid biosynthesis glycosyltransferase